MPNVRRSTRMIGRALGPGAPGRPREDGFQLGLSSFRGIWGCRFFLGGIFSRRWFSCVIFPLTTIPNQGSLNKTCRHGTLVWVFSWTL